MYLKVFDWKIEIWLKSDVFKCIKNSLKDQWHFENLMIALALLESINYEKKCERKQLIRKVEKFQ